MDASNRKVREIVSVAGAQQVEAAQDSCQDLVNFTGF